MNKRYFYVIISLVVALLIGIWIGLVSYNNESTKKQSTTYAVISTPDGNTIAGYADDVIFHEGYVTVTIRDSKYTTDLNNVLLIEK